MTTAPLSGLVEPLARTAASCYRRYQIMSRRLSRGWMAREYFSGAAVLPSPSSLPSSSFTSLYRFTPRANERYPFLYRLSAICVLCELPTPRSFNDETVQQWLW